MNTKQQIVFLVAGMHRSGTSALTRVINFHGISVAEGLMQATDDNPSGYWESQELSDFHESYLKKIGLTWDSTLLRPKDWQITSDFHEAREWIKTYLQKEFQDSQYFVIKDPRISRLLPLWEKALEELGISIRVVIPYRKPSEVAASLHKREITNHGHNREGFNQEGAHLLWLRYVLDVEYDSRQFQRTFVGYDKLLTDWLNLRDKIEKDLEFDFPTKTEDVTLKTNNFLSPNLNRNVSDAQIVTKNVAYAWIDKAFQALQLLEQDPQHQAAQRSLDIIKAELLASDGLFDAYIRDLQNKLAHSKHVIKLTYQHVDNLENGFVGERQNYDRQIHKLSSENTALTESVEKLTSKAEALDLQNTNYKSEIMDLKTDNSNAALLYNSEYFDAEWYLRKYKDVKGINPITHYLKYGAKEMRNPSLWFNTHFYCKNNADALKNDMNPLVHYISYGQELGYLPRENMGAIATFWIRILDVFNRPKLYLHKVKVRILR